MPEYDPDPDPDWDVVAMMSGSDNDEQEKGDEVWICEAGTAETYMRYCTWLP